MTARIIVVDDEPDLRALVSDYLGMHGFAVRTAATAKDLDAELARLPAEVILLDVNMPGESGFDALGRLRAAGVRAGVIMLTAAGTLDDRLAGLCSGADDYLVKPFAPRELLARVRAVLRRLPAAEPAAPAPIEVGRCRLDLVARRLLDPDGSECAMTPMEFDLLEVFVRHPDRTLSRERLCELAHGRPLAPGDRSIDIRILRLRQKIEPDAQHPQFLVSIRGEGYVFRPGR
ncbi:MAG TPA: response regulator [Amaricoccus sp.]|uniref:response regulator n=1 Tax=Amaricoccus sp. TaxID=1872485 RepID=UPI002D15E353|nr:response regulator [Amaricoccus sp.]HPG21908.1 response regulator [Amaricoccus sp.]HRW15672.1 response regulator [Amaricoccus sp.]